MQESEARSQETEVRSEEVGSDAPGVAADAATMAGSEAAVDCAAGSVADAVAEHDGVVDPECDPSDAAEPDSDSDPASVSSVIAVASTEPDSEQLAAGAEAAVEHEALPAETAPEPEQGELAAGDDPALCAVVEAIVYVTEEPVTAAQIAAVVKRPEAEVKGVLERLVQSGAAPERGIAVREIAGGYKMATKPEHHEMLRAFAKSLKPPLKLSLAALETLATIAYKQPITAPEIMEIRGVQGAGVLKTLLDRKLIQTAGRKSVVGKPILYRTTKEFLVQFGLKDLSELPTLKEFEELRRLAATEPETPEEQADSAQAEAPQPEAAAERAAEEPETEASADAGTPAAEACGGETVPEAAAGEAPLQPEAAQAEDQPASEDANAPGTAPEDSGERRGDEPAES